MRGLSISFLDSLKSGLLHPILNRIKNDDTLMLSIRKGYINIYYRGGNILKITERPNSFYFHFDKKYDLSNGHEVFNSLTLQETINDSNQVEKWVAAFASLKELMDFWLNKNPKLEREFQQLVERENNMSSISNETEYFISDIELAYSKLGARFDMTAIKWTANSRRNSRNCKPTFIEMKYGDAALSGKAGLIKHIRDIHEFLSNKKNYEIILEVMSIQFNQLDELGLLKFKHSRNNTKMKISISEKPEFIFLFANHNPRSTKLKTILLDPEFTKYIDPGLFDLLFYVNSDAGYGLHNKNMLTYQEYMNRRAMLPTVESYRGSSKVPFSNLL